MDVTDLSGPSDGCLEVMKEMSVSAPENMEMSQPPVPPLNVDQRLQILSVDMPVNISPLKPESTEAVLDLEGEGCVSVNGHAADDTDEGSGEAGTDGNAGVQQNIDLKDIKPIQVVNSSGIIPEGQHFIIVTNDHGMFDTEEDSSNSKRLKMEGQNNETYFLTVSSLPVAEREIRKRPAKQPKTGCSAQIAPHEDVSQAWFTTKDDKNAIKNQGVTWKKGAWSKEEVEILQANIVEYCQSNSISDPEEIIFKTSKEMRKDFYRSIAKGLERPLFSVYRRVIRMYDQRNHIGKYSQAEMEQLKELRRKHGADWAHIGAAMGRSASSVKDKCRLMNDSCNSGKWLPEEETRLAQAVYELSGCQAGESITHGLSWSMVAEKVGSRSEKQCRTKWLNFLNWKVKGGAEWTREDDISLVLKISQLDVDDETDIDWQELAENWPSVRSPQWLRGKWWSIKRHVQDYQTLPFRDIVSCLHTMHMAVRLKTTNNMNMRVSRVDVPRLSITPDLSARLPSELCITGGTEERSLLVGDGKCTEGDVQAYEPSSLLAGEGKATEGGLQAYEVMHHLTPTSSGTFLITHPQGKVESGLTSDSIIVHTLPVNSQGSLEGSQIAVLESPEDAVTSLGGSELTGIQLVQQGLSQSTLGNGDLQLSHQGEIIHVALTEASQEELAELGRSETVTSDLVMVNSASPQYVQAASNQGQLLSSLTDPMLTSQSSDLICSTSDAEGDKSQGHESDMVPIEN